MSIKDKITQGKWVNVSKPGAGITGRIKAPTDQTIADFYTFSEGISDEEAKANADCAAALPEMLSIIERLAANDFKHEDEAATEYYELNLQAINLLKELNK